MTISQLKSKLIISLLNIILLLVLTANVRANEYYVAKNGNDNNSGSEANPWLTIQKAASMAHAGDTVYIKNGTYTELVTIQNSGNSGSYIAFKQYPGHKAIIDGTGNAGWWGVISIQGKSYIKLDGFEIRNNNTGWGVLVEGSSRSEVSNIELVNLNVHHTGGEAIQIRGNTNSAHHVTITNCTVHDGTGGASGIDVYMYNGGRPHHVVVGGSTAYNFPTFAAISSEQADNIVIENNVSYGNAYGLDIGSGANNVVRYNTVYNCSDLGIAISSNQDSLIYNNTIHDISGDGVALYSYYWSAHGEAHARNEYYNNVSYSVNCGVFESNYKQPSGGAGTSTRHKYYNNVFSNVGPCFECLFETGDPVKKIRAIVLAEGIDLVFTATRREDVKHRIIRGGTTARRLLPGLPCSVALVRVVHMGRTHPREILVALKKQIDHITERSEFTALLAKAFEATVHLFHVTRPVTKFFHGEMHLTPVEWEEKVPPDMSRFISHLDGYGVEHEKRLSPGTARKSIAIEAASRRRDLIVMGASERGIIDQFLHRTPVEEVLRETPCNLIILKPGK